MSNDPRTILIFEDNPAIQQILKFFCQKRGFNPVVFGDAADSEEAVRTHGPALIVMDYIMPGKDGVAACADLRAAGVSIPIIMLTAKTQAADRKRALDAGASIVLSKPVHTADLDNAFQHFLPRETA